MTMQLKNLLRKALNYHFGKDLVLNDYAASKLSGDAGEHNGSLMLAITATVRKNGSSRSEVLQAVAKLFPNEYYQEIFNSELRFKKEITAYEEIFPAYYQLQKENGISIDKIADMFPKYYGSKMPDKPKTSASEQYDAIILLENLKSVGYSCGERLKGLDLAHTEMAVSNLAIFHALGVALKLKKPETFAALKGKAVTCAMPDLLISAGIENTKNMTLQNSRLKPFHDRIAKALDSGAKKLKAPCLSPFGTMSHEDFWVTNVMFRRDVNERPTALKFVDFQTYTYQSPIRDLFYFLIGSTAENVFLNNFGQLIDSYYESFTQTLVELDCDVAPYGRDQFNAECQEWADAVVTYCSAMLKAILLPESAINRNSGDIPITPEYYNDLVVEAATERLTLMFICFLERNLI